MNLIFVPIAVLVLTLLYSAITDASRMKISNRLSLTVLVCFAVATPIAWESWAVFGEHMLVGLTYFVLGIVLWSVGGFGGGDAKIMAATALFFTFGEAFQYALYTTLYGGALALFVLIGRQFVPPQIATNGLVYSLFNEAKKIPYGIALTLAALTVLPTSDLVLRAIG